MEEDECIIDALAEKAYEKYCGVLSENLDYFEKKEIMSYKELSMEYKKVWKEVVKEIICCYPVLENKEKLE